MARVVVWASQAYNVEFFDSAKNSHLVSEHVRLRINLKLANVRKIRAFSPTSVTNVFFASDKRNEFHIQSNDIREMIRLPWYLLYQDSSKYSNLISLSVLMIFTDTTLEVLLTLTNI